MQDSTLIKSPSKKGKGLKKLNLPLSGFDGLKVILFFGFAYFLSYAFRAVNAVIAPELIADLKIGNSVLGLLSSAYFVGFALMQLPLGVWLDKYGSRRTESLLLLSTFVGSLLFAWAENIMWVSSGRALIGVGVSSSLMAAFTAYRQWFKPEQQGSLASGMLVFGTAGALMTTMPVQAALPYLGWRGIFYVMALLVALASAGIWFGLPKGGDPRSKKHLKLVQNLDVQSVRPKKIFAWLTSYGQIFKNGFFLQMLPIGIFNQGGFIAVQTLWLGPWFLNVVGLPEATVARALFIFNGVLLCGYLLNTWLVPRINKNGISTFKYSILITGVAITAQWSAVTTSGDSALYWWYFFGFCATGFILGQSLVQMHFPSSMTGRASTAYNLALFIGAFLIQWGIGWGIDLGIAQGLTKAEAFRLTMEILIFVQLLAYIWIWIAPRVLNAEQFVYREHL